ncbi:patatin-like phospholipase family protein [Phaeovulum vinaykumarii]|uniref:NTE family protein n=1 Tax=Phaeovulum vinaykumarii TaxID=407234 RepID=A0A1N7LTH3_9RHOB|nr:patatin-like phospholipase family protein [Phaeovulum vinaykumarii]SIS77158.1 NTE family protein [Phaeovulum vinaykumarii]SOC07562.1 NTE family protein [Phaeovulum vinaykumarii]
MKIGLALGSGGARGWGHIGVLRAFYANGLTPDIICGTSMGALVGAMAASGALDSLEDFVRGLSPGQVRRMIDPNLAAGGLIAGTATMRKLRDLGLRARIEDLDLPFLAVATDLNAGREVWLRSGDLAEAVRASIAIPGIFTPVWNDGRWLLDGGMTNPVPVSACRAMGADIVIAVDPNAGRFVPVVHSAPGTTRGAAAAAAPPDGVKAQAAAEGAVTETMDPAKGTPEPGGRFDWLTRALPELPFERLSLGMPELPPPLRELLGPSPDPVHRPPGYLEVLSTSIDVMTDHIRRSRLAGDPPHVLVEFALQEMSVLDFSAAGAAIDEGHTAAMAQMPLIERLLG